MKDLKPILKDLGIQPREFIRLLGCEESYGYALIGGRKAVSLRMAQRMECLTGGKIRAAWILGLEHGTPPTGNAA